MPHFANMRPLAWWLLFISGIFNLSIGLSNIFVNIFVWKIDHSYTAIGQYNISIYIVMPLAFIVAAWVSKIANLAFTMRAGIGLHAVFYATALFVGNAAAHIPALLGALLGFAAGFYWYAFNSLSLVYTQDASRDQFFGYNGVLAAIAGMVAPPVAGYCIAREDRFGGLSGYHVVFGLSFALFVAAVCLSFKLRAAAIHAPLHLGQAFAALRKKAWCMVMAGCAVYGMREGVFLFLIGLLLYVATGSELRLGQFLLLQSALSFGSFFLVGRLAKPHNRLFILALGALGMAGAALLFLLPVSARTIVWYGCIVAVVLPMFLVPLQGIVFDSIGNLAERIEDQAKFIVLREIFENSGRVIGIAGFLFVTIGRVTAFQISRFAVCLGFVQLVTLALLAIGFEWGSRVQQEDFGR